MPTSVKEYGTGIGTVEGKEFRITVDRFDGGLNTKYSNSLLRDDEAIVRQNWHNDAYGDIEVVRGYDLKNTSQPASAAVMGLFRVYQSGGLRKGLAIINGTMYYSDNNFGTLTAATGGTGFGTEKVHSGVNFNDLFFVTSRDTNLKHYTPGTNTVANATDKPPYPCAVIRKLAEGRLIAVNNDINGSTLYFSKLNPTGTDSDDWSATNDAGSVAVDGAKSEKTISAFPWESGAIALKSYGAFRTYGFPSVTATIIPASPGCDAPHAVVWSTKEGKAYFLNKEGIWMFDGTVFLRISEVIQSLIDEINPAYIENATAVYRLGYIWFFWTASGDITNKKCVIYDAKHSNPYEGRNIWYERINLNIASPVYFDGTGDDNELYGGTSQATGKIYRLDFSSSGRDESANTTAAYQTKYFDAGLPNVIKNFKRIRIKLIGNGGTLTVTWYTNDGATSGSYTVTIDSISGFTLDVSRLDVGTLGGSAQDQYSRQNLPDMAVGRNISVKIEHSGTATRPRIKEVTIEGQLMYEN